MFACILNTNPEKSGSRSADDDRGRSGAAAGLGASVSSARRNGSTPKSFSALPKNTGVCRSATVGLEVEPGAGAARSFSTASINWRCARRRPVARRRIVAGSVTATGSVRCPRAALVEQHRVGARGRRRRRTVSPSPIGQFIGAAAMPSTRSIWSSSSNGSRRRLIQLVDERQHRQSRARHTSNSFRSAARSPWPRRAP